jgi:hypothetical protein
MSGYPFFFSAGGGHGGDGLENPARDGAGIAL